MRGVSRRLIAERGKGLYSGRGNDMLNDPLSSQPLPREQLSPANSSQSSRPLGVTLSALYQFGKAAYLAYAFHGIWALHQAAVASGQTDADPFARSPFCLALPLYAGIMVVAGIGLLALAPWARHMFLITGTLGLPWLPHGFSVGVFNSILDYGLLKQYLPRDLMLTMVVLDALVYAALMGSSSSRAFGESQGDPFYNKDSDLAD